MARPYFIAGKEPGRRGIPSLVPQILVYAALAVPATSALSAHAPPQHTLPGNAGPAGQPPQFQRVDHSELPIGLSEEDWGALRKQIDSASYQARAHRDGGLRALNPAHGWLIDFAADGTTELAPRDVQANHYRLNLKLVAFGAGQRHAVERPERITVADNAVHYQWNAYLREWWVNSHTGLEQWFRLEQRPPGAGGGPLTLEMKLATDLQSRQQGNGVRFVDDDGTVIGYNKLKAWDADGRELPAWMRLTANDLLLHIDDSAARYPLTIDPTFQQEGYIKASNTNAFDQFGWTVAVSGDTAVVGAWAEDSSATGINGNQNDNSASQAGAVYVFVREGTTWNQQAYIKASNTDAHDRFGETVDISGDTIVVGAWAEASSATGINGNQNNNSAPQSGAAYVFTRSGTTWSQQAYLKASNAAQGDYFGESVAISGNTIVVGARLEDSNATGVNGNQANNSASSAGAAYVFVRTGTNWSQQAYLKASNTEAGDYFGERVAIDGDTIAVATYVEDSAATGVNGNQNDNSAPQAGAVYVFVRTGTTWSQQAYIKSSNTEIGDWFGESLAVSGDTLVVGAWPEASNAKGVNGNQQNNSALESGAAYVFVRNGTVWSQQAYLKASNTNAGDRFGDSVGISGDTIVIGASMEASRATGFDGNQDDNTGAEAGAAYVFGRSGTVWSQQAYVKASNTQVPYHFGFSVDVENDTIVIGSPDERSKATRVDGDQLDRSLHGAGAAYAFSFTVEEEEAYTVGGQVSGLQGSGLVLQNNAGDDLAINANGSFTFATPLADGSSYSVTVSSQPTNPAQACKVDNASGTVAGADVTNVVVTCDSEMIFVHTFGD